MGVKYYGNARGVALSAWGSSKLPSVTRWESSYRIGVEIDRRGGEDGIAITINDMGMFLPFHCLNRVGEIARGLVIELPDWLDSKTFLAFDGIANTRQIRQIQSDYEHGEFLDNPFELVYVNNISTKALRELIAKARLKQEES